MLAETPWEGANVIVYLVERLLKASVSIVM